MIQLHQILKRPGLGVIAMVTLGTLVLVNWNERGRFGVPEDGVVWADLEAGVTATEVQPDSPAALVGVRPDDILHSIGGQDVDEALDVARLLSAVGSWNRTQYKLEREGHHESVYLLVGESTGRSSVSGFLLVLGFVYALIGLLVWLRCPAGFTTNRFGLFCLSSFALYSLGYSGQLNGFDRLVFWIDNWALLLMPPLFLDFCLHFPDNKSRQKILSQAAYGLAITVGLVQHALIGEWVSIGIPETLALQIIDVITLALLVVNLLVGAMWVHNQSNNRTDPVIQKQRQWLVTGVLVSVIPFAALYAVPYMLGVSLGPNQTFIVFSLALLPFCIAVSLLQYRLMDLEILWRRAASTAMAGSLLLAGFYILLFRQGTPVSWLERYGPVTWLLSLFIAVALFQPLRNWLYDSFERRLYRQRYSDRRALSSFASELASETDLNHMFRSVVDRLDHCLDVDRSAILGVVAGEDSATEHYVILYQQGILGIQLGQIIGQEVLLHSSTDTSPVFLDLQPGDHHDSGLRQLGCSHYVPCRLRGKTLAWIGLGRKRHGSFLNSDDLALAESLAGPFAIALENAQLYRSLEQKALQYQQLKDYNENIVESLSVGILSVDLQDRIQSWNTQLELLFNISRDQAAGRLLGDLLPDALVREFNQGRFEARNVYKYKLRAADFPEEFKPANAVESESAARTVNVAIAPLITRSFQPIGRLMILDDITDLVELEDRVSHADKLSSVGLLAAGVAHEVNTPLAVISSYAQLLAERFKQESDEAKLLGKMTEQTFHASEIVNSLLDFSRTAETSMAPCDIDSTLRDTLALIKPQLRKSSINVHLDLAADDAVQGNRGKLQQVFLNLFLNARDAMPEGGELHVTSHSLTKAGADSRVEILISDTGVGMEPKQQAQIFDPFYTTKGPGHGTGLGLAVSYGIIQEHFGAISVKSKPGQGTTITLAFPLVSHPVHA